MARRGTDIMFAHVTHRMALELTVIATCSAAATTQQRSDANEGSVVQNEIVAEIKRLGGKSAFDKNGTVIS